MIRTVTCFSIGAAAAFSPEAKSFKEAGFRAVKMKVGLLLVSEDLRRVQATREAIGQIHSNVRR